MSEQSVSLVPAVPSLVPPPGPDAARVRSAAMVTPDTADAMTPNLFTGYVAGPAQIALDEAVGRRAHVVMFTRWGNSAKGLKETRHVVEFCGSKGSAYTKYRKAVESGNFADGFLSVHTSDGTCLRSSYWYSRGFSKKF